jgi:hypothetical protein
MASGSYTSAERLFTNSETIERHPGSGNLDCRGGQTVQDSRLGEYHDTPEKTRKCTPEVIRSSKDTTDSPQMAPKLRSTRQNGSGSRTMLMGGRQLHLYTIPANTKERPATRG